MDKEKANTYDPEIALGQEILPGKMVKNPLKTYNYIGKKYAIWREKMGNLMVVENKLLRGFMAELLGTFVFMSFSLGSLAQFTFQKSDLFLSANISFGFGLTMGIIVCGKVSGGHLNPAVSLAMLLLGRVTLLRYFVYMIAQNLGAFLASVMVYLTYLHEIVAFTGEGGPYGLKTAGIFSTYPLSNTTSLSSTVYFSNFFDQFFATTLFIIGVLAITDIKNTNIPHVVKAVLVGLILLIIGTSYGMHCGFPVNPARDFSPRLFTLMAGWGTKVFSAYDYFFWVPLVGPMIGSAFGTILYQLFIANHWPEDELY